MNPPNPTPAELLDVLAGEYTAFADLTASLTEAEWSAPTRCTTWQVRDVTGHVVCGATESLEGTIGSRTPDEQAASLRDATPAEAASLLRAAFPRLISLLEPLDEPAWRSPSPVPGRTLYNGVLTLCYDTFVHHDDIRVALGLPRRRGPGLAASVAWLCEELARLERGPLRVEPDGLPPRRIGDGGPTVTGDPLSFVMAASGRTDPASLGLEEKVNVHLLP